VMTLIRYKLLELAYWEPKGNTLSRDVKTIPTTDVTFLHSFSVVIIDRPICETLLGLSLGNFSAT
jgi:hypothetical protein